MTDRKISLARMALHDFNRAIRAWRGHLSAKEIIFLLSEQRRRALMISMKALLVATIGTLWLLANKTEMSLKVALVDLSIPVAYVDFAVSVCLMTSIIHSLSYFLLNDFVRIAAKHLLKFDSPWALTAVVDGESVWSNAITPQWRFFNSGESQKRLAKLTLFFVNLPLLAITTICWVTAIRVGLHVLSTEGVFSVGGMLIIVSWLTLLCSLSMIVVLRTPFTFSKNKRYIQWLFLYKIYKRLGLMPPRVNDWIAADRGKNKI
jgi:hypothetical protein